MDLLNQILLIVVSYLIGSIPFGLLIVRIGTGKDVRQVGSGRTGTTNAMRAAGILAGVLTLLFDALKGFSSRYIALWLYPGDVWFQVLAAIFVILGHNYSIFLLRRDEHGKFKFEGGAGGAPCLGGAMALWPSIGFALFPIGAIIFLFVGYASLTTMSVAVFSIIIFAYRAYLGLNPWAYVFYGLIAFAIILWALRPNIERLRQGTERVVGLRSYWLKKKEKANIS